MMRRRALSHTILPIYILSASCKLGFVFLHLHFEIPWRSGAGAWGRQISSRGHRKRGGSLGKGGNVRLAWTGAASPEAGIPEDEFGLERLRAGYQNERRVGGDAAGTGGIIHCTGNLSYIHILGGIILMGSAWAINTIRYKQNNTYVDVHLFPLPSANQLLEWNVS
jgi:hypothetical protein